MSEFIGKLSNLIARNTRKSFLLTFGVGFYAISALDFRTRDESNTFISDQASREDSFYLTLEGQQELAIAREIKRNEHRLRIEQEKELENTEEGREELEGRRVERSLSLRYKATNLQYELLKLEREIDKHETTQRMQTLDKVRMLRNASLKAGAQQQQQEP